MVNWNIFIYFALPSLILWTAGAVFAWKERRILAHTFTISGMCIFAAFIIGLWMSLERPPLRTMGETRLWYSAFLPLAGITVYARWHYKWILSFSTIMATVFICINLFRPEIHSKTLMPALQSPWFAPHVIVYMFCYAILGSATLVAIWQLLPSKLKAKLSHAQLNIKENENTDATLELVCTGLSFMTFGMLFGALWAKEAWGHYWAWDPKETWAAATWLSYLTYIHLCISRPNAKTIANWILIFSFCCLQMCWWGINYLPSAQGNSVHTYSTK